MTLKEVLRGVIDAVPQVTSRPARQVTPAAAGTQADGSARLTQAAYWQALQGYLRPGDVLFTDNGTSYAIFGFRLPPDCTVVASVIWGSIGYSVGALLGTLTAAPQRRHLLFVGDGSFQETAQELSTMLRHDCKPVIFLINNGGYTIERGYMGKTETYNDVATWAYADLPKVFRPDTTARSFVVKTVADLHEALSAPNDTLIFIESIMDPHDAPAAVIHSSNNGAELDYGPRGPQHRAKRPAPASRPTTVERPNRPNASAWTRPRLPAHAPDRAARPHPSFPWGRRYWRPTMPWTAARESGGQAMPNDSTRTVLVAIGADLGVALAKVGTAVFTGSSAVAAGAAESLADTANDVFLLIAQRRSSRPPDDQHPLGYGREAYFWALIAALGVFVTAAAFSLREGIDELIHPGATSSFAVAYIVLGISAVLDLVSFRQSGGQMSLRARRYHRDLLEEARVTSDPTLRIVFTSDAVSVSADVLALAALALNQITGSSIYQAVAAVLIALALIRLSLRLIHIPGSGRGAHRAGADPS